MGGLNGTPKKVVRQYYAGPNLAISPIHHNLVAGGTGQGREEIETTLSEAIDLIQSSKLFTLNEIRRMNFDQIMYLAHEILTN